MMNRNYPGGPPNRFIGYFGDLMYLNFPPVKMGIGIEIIKSADLLGIIISFISLGNILECKQSFLRW